ncbi:FAD-dependent oxidoreductase [Bradyrhizobium sp. BWA-3-5]|uniref:NAD(P)/FAD-dependent oxidoreductase n=1 Tax=Bradyrhizobium sp. BWA-3-5 TaxID=3080013 RepID=UPI00293E42EC|nr:FAD-dependent oxidoreductase [Bradyrhizobium sp. BWA-3-5]WOH63722.1 FAD-dependent oxidoreductase [Bradyrhizobium sp. BWA-3-5]
MAGIACAYYLARQRPNLRIAIIDQQAPMSLTSAASGENYRNWWPHEIMTEFTDHSIDLLEEIARRYDNRIHMTRRGYVLATREPQPDALLEELHRGYGPKASERIRIHGKKFPSTYTPAISSDWDKSPDGVDIIQGSERIRQCFPQFDPGIETVLHIRRAGDISGQQLGSLMLESIRALGGIVISARVVEIASKQNGFTLKLAGREGDQVLQSEILVNAAGPYIAEIAAMLGERLPVENVFQQKIAFADALGAIDRRMPFSIDLDGQSIDWTDQEREMLLEDPKTAWLARPMPGGIHCRPEGGDQGKWIKLGWAYNRASSPTLDNPPIDPNFPDIVLRAASRLHGRLKQYYGRLPRRITHYGGYYTMTKENWPLIGPMRTKGAFIAGALSGFGTMAACATGSLCAGWISQAELPSFAPKLSLSRYDDKMLMGELLGDPNTGVL